MEILKFCSINKNMFSITSRQQMKINKLKELKKYILKSFQESGKKHLLITGSKKSGKTKFLKEILEEEDSVGGIITYPIRDEQIPPRYVLLSDLINPSLRGVIGVRNKECSSLIPLTGTFEVLGTCLLNKYLKSNIKIIVLDEIGFLENWAFEYQRAILNCLEEKKGILVIRKSLTPFIEELLNRKDVYILDIDNFK